MHLVVMRRQNMNRQDGGQEGRGSQESPGRYQSGYRNRVDREMRGRGDERERSLAPRHPQRGLGVGQIVDGPTEFISIVGGDDPPKEQTQFLVGLRNALFGGKLS